MSDLIKEYFEFSVDLNAEKRTAKWEDTNHPDNPNFMNTVSWFAYHSSLNHVEICYSLEGYGKGAMINHKRIKINKGETFSDAVFNIFRSQSYL